MASLTRYPDGSFRICRPVKVEYEGYMREFGSLTTAQLDEIGYNMAVPLKREPHITYETEWDKGEDLVYREVAVSAIVDEAARDEVMAKTVREQRDRFLADSDWTQLADAPLSEAEKAAWVTRRQAWRDVPQQEGFPGGVVWPE